MQLLILAELGTRTVAEHLIRGQIGARDGES